MTIFLLSARLWITEASCLSLKAGLKNDLIEDCKLAARVGLLAAIPLRRFSASMTRDRVLASAAVTLGFGGLAGMSVTTVFLPMACFAGTAFAAGTAALVATGATAGLPKAGILATRLHAIFWPARCLMSGSDPVSPEMMVKVEPGNSVARRPI